MVLDFQQLLSTSIPLLSIRHCIANCRGPSPTSNTVFPSKGASVETFKQLGITIKGQMSGKVWAMQQDNDEMISLLKSGLNSSQHGDFTQVLTSYYVHANEHITAFEK